MTSELTIVLVYRKGGDYTIKDVSLLACHLRKQWQGSLRIICICDGFRKPCKLTKSLLLIPMKNLWKGWWSKMNMFSPEMEKYRPFLYIDLDTAIVGSLNDLFPPVDQTKFITLENVYYPGHIGSGLMWIPANNKKVKAIWDKWIANPEKGMTDPGGDQKFIEKTITVDDYFEKERITSFKPAPRQHWLRTLNSKLSIVYFHGYPRIPQAGQRIPWVTEYLKCKEVKVSDELKRYFVINLDSRLDRLNEFKQNKFPFEVERFPAIKMNPGIKGCNASHVAILNKECELPFAVFEDDCKLVDDWCVVENAMQQLPEDWDLLLVGANLNSPLEQYSANLFKVKNAWTTHALIYGSQGVVDYIRQNMPKDTTPIDVFYSKNIYPRFNCFVVSPLVAIQRGSFSDVNNGIRNYEELMITNFKQNTTKLNYENWFTDKGDSTHRLNYLLNEKSVVFDVGGYEGTWAKAILDKFHCNIYIFEPVASYYANLVKMYEAEPKVKVYPFAISDKIGADTIYLSKDSSGMYSKGTPETINCITMQRAMELTKVKQVDLLKLNIEGSEYPVLLNMLNTGLIGLFDNIQVQFHTFIEEYGDKYNTIKAKLSNTHQITFKYPFIWENWKNVMGSYSQIGQDKFVLSHFPQDHKGTFMDVGCSLPQKLNNTLLLEKHGWDGWSFDILDYKKQWRSRKSKFIQANVLTVDYVMLDLPEYIDYLSLDIEGDGMRFKALQKVMALPIEFAVITIEHDAYRGYTKSEKEPQRKLLKEKGYKLVCADVQHNGCIFEDWYINPKYITK